MCAFERPLGQVWFKLWMPDKTRMEILAPNVPYLPILSQVRQQLSSKFCRCLYLDRLS